LAGGVKGKRRKTEAGYKHFKQLKEEQTNELHKLIFR